MAALPAYMTDSKTTAMESQFFYNHEHRGSDPFPSPLTEDEMFDFAAVPHYGVGGCDPADTTGGLDIGVDSELFASLQHCE
jgi:hypothetical protein